ncbi:unnamed protein product [Mytilus edulis]|uniref:CCHC-type domain-containing protein n=1 Tax=Mytilus edulis TaxID=6550 RepID=A0A8S3S5R6_MYTED|nr:unnamed protein product [Mytilus edulis]
MNHLTSVYKQLSNLIENESESHCHSELINESDTEIFKRYETCENYHADLMKRITTRVQEIDRDNVETRGSYTFQGYSVPTVSLQGQGQLVSNVDQSRQAKSTTKVRPLILDQSALNVSQSFVQSESSVPVMTHLRSEQVVTNVNSMPVVTSVSSATLNALAITFIPQNINTANVTGQYIQIEDLMKSLAEQVSLSRLPPPKPSVFFGDPLKYPAWKSSFQTLIEQRKILTFERIHYLRKFVGDSVREVIENFLILSTENAYDDAKELLEKRFGDPFIISNAFRDRLDNWPKHGKYDNQRRNVLATETSRVPDKNNNSYNKDLTCTFCKKTGHFIDSCYQFLKRSVNERKNFAKENALCFGCLGCGHTSKKCQKRKKCEVCSRFHPTSLHGDFQKPIISVNKDKPLETGTVENYKTQTGAVFMNNTKASCKSSMIVPVYVWHSDDPENERLVYDLLDTQSDTTFVLDETRRALGLCGTDVKLSLSTMHAENHIVDSRKIKGLVVRGFDSEVRIPLPQVFTRDIMPANRSHIPTAEMARRWSYLEHLAEKMMPVRDCEFGIFIGYNCPRALIPREVIPSIDNGPYGQKTDLGWGIVGIVDPLQIDNCDSIGFSHRTLALQVPNELSIKGNKSGDSEHVYFSFGSSVKEIIPSDGT